MNVITINILTAHIFSQYQENDNNHAMSEFLFLLQSFELLLLETLKILLYC